MAYLVQASAGTRYCCCLSPITWPNNSIFTDQIMTNGDSNIARSWAEEVGSFHYGPVWQLAWLCHSRRNNYVPLIERWSRFTQTAFVCLGRNSLNRCCQVSSRSTAIALPYTQSIWVFPLESPRKTLHVIKCHGGWSRAHLTVSTERVLFQTNKSCLCKSISPFTMGHYGSQYDYVIT